MEEKVHKMCYILLRVSKNRKILLWLQVHFRGHKYYSIGSIEKKKQVIHCPIRLGRVERLAQSATEFLKSEAYGARYPLET